MRNPEALRQVARLFTILYIAGRRRGADRVGRQQLAAACCCSVKTIQRDIDLLQEMQVPIRYEDASGSYVLYDKEWRLPIIQFTADDLLALALLRAWFGREGNTFPFTDAISTALRKTTSMLPPDQMALFNSAAATIAEIGGLARDYSDAPIGDLILAITQQRTVEMRYESRSRSPGRREPRRIDPYRLDLRDGRYLELQAWCHDRSAVRTFAVDRIEGLSLTDHRFARRPWTPDDDAIAGGLRGGPPVVVDVLFDAETAPFAQEHAWTFRPTCRRQADGSLRMTATVRGTEGILKTLLAWGAHVRVLGGPELRERMAVEVHALAALYEKSSPDVPQGHADVPGGLAHSH